MKLSGWFNKALSSDESSDRSETSNKMCKEVQITENNECKIWMIEVLLTGNGTDSQGSQ